ncbi:MAG TPA: efflux RND transporter permease subunit [Terracidiphilus sp.]|nr:efflux RND transporter permease subunit [Terracidiphilus sp.]
MNISRPFIIRPVATVLLMVAILLVGLVAYLQLPISALPEVNYPTIQVQTFYPGASPDVMASTVTEPLEKQFGQIPGLSQMTSTSSGGASVVVLQFSLREDIDVAEQEVQAAINSATSYLPSDLPIPPTYSKTNPADAPVLTLALTSKSLALPQLQDLADTRLAPKISQLSGVGLVTVEGGQKPAVRIQANPAALSSYGLTLEDIRTAITGTSVNGAKGSLSGAQQAFTIDANDQLTSADQYKNIVVSYKNGSAVALHDVANVINSVEDSQRAAYMNETPAIIVDIRRQSTANTIKVVDSIKTLLPQLQATLPAAVEVKILSDRTTTIRASVEDVEFELSLTIGLVVMVIFLFLRSWRATIIPSVAVPLSLIGTFAVMYKLGYSLNNLSLMALTIATGFVVDDAIVMVENISRYLEEGLPPLEAALRGAKEIGFTIVSLTVSLVAVLIPLLFMSDITGRLFREFAVTLAVTIIVSAIVSLTLTPMMASKLLKHVPTEKQGRFYHWSEGVFERVIAFYGRTLKWVLERQFATLMVALATVIGAGLLYYYIPKGFFPIQDTGLIQVITEAPEATSFDAMTSRQAQLARIVLEDPAVESLSSMVGIDGTNTTVNSGRMQITLKPLAERHISASDVMRRLRPKLNGVTGIKAYLQPVQDLTVEDRVSRTQFQYTIEDPNQEELKEWTDKLVAKLKTIPEIEDVATDEQPNGNALQLDIDRVTASRLGISPQTLDDTLYDAFGQRQATTLYTQTNQYHVILEALPQFKSDPERLQDIYLQGSSSSSSTSSSSGSTSSTSQLTASSTQGVSAVTSSSSTLATTSASSQLSSSTGSSSSSSSSTGTVLQATSSSSSQSTTGSTSGSGSSASSSTSSSSTTPVPLAAFVTMKRTLKPLTISHQAQFPVVTISFNLAPNAHLSQAVDAIEKAEKSLNLPVNAQTGFQGTAASFKNSLTNEGLLVLAALVTVYIVLGVLYESYIHPLTILSTLPSAGVGALLALMMFKQDLGIVGIIGIVLLIGIVKKNGIMMVDFALQAERDEGKPPREAIYSACLLRFRPILMTTLAALFAGLPLAFGTGIGAELRRPLGIAMVGGLLVSQVLTLYTTPVIYLWFDRLSERFARKAAVATKVAPAEGEA